MPIKQVLCSVCKTLVNKAQTYHIGGLDRACKSHEGVIQKKDTLKEQQENQAERKRRRDVDHPPRNGGWSGTFGLKCWVCMNPGIRQEEYFTKVLVEMEKQKKIHGRLLNPLDPKYAIRIGERCIFILCQDKVNSALKYVREDFNQLVGMSGALAICGPCCRVCKIDPLPPVNFDDLVRGSAMYSAFLEPVIEAVAGAELARDN